MFQGHEPTYLDDAIYGKSSGRMISPVLDEQFGAEGSMIRIIPNLQVVTTIRSVPVRDPSSQVRQSTRE